MDEIKLKPCPFCGCPMVIDTVPGYNMKDKMYFLAGDPAHAKGCMIGAMVTPRFYDKDKIAEYWNRRAEHE